MVAVEGELDSYTFDNSIRRHGSRGIKCLGIPIRSKATYYLTHRVSFCGHHLVLLSLVPKGSYWYKRTITYFTHIYLSQQDHYQIYHHHPELARAWNHRMDNIRYSLMYALKYVKAYTRSCSCHHDSSTSLCLARREEVTTKAVIKKDNVSTFFTFHLC